MPPWMYFASGGIVGLMVGLWLHSNNRKQKRESLIANRLELLKETESKIPRFKKQAQDLPRMEQEIKEHKPERYTLAVQVSLKNFAHGLATVERTCALFQKEDPLNWNVDLVSELLKLQGFLLDRFYGEVKDVHTELLLSDRDLIILAKQEDIARRNRSRSGGSTYGGIF